MLLRMKKPVLISLVCSVLVIIFLIFPGAPISQNADHSSMGQVSNTTQSSPDTIHVALLAYGEKALEDAYIVIKSIALFSRSSICFHVFSSDNAGHALNKRVADWPAKFRHNIRIHPYEVKCVKWMKEIKKHPEQSFHFTSPTMIKTCMFLSLEQSWNMTAFGKKLVYLDIDVILLDDILNLWKQSENFNSTHVMTMAGDEIRFVVC